MPADAAREQGADKQQEVKVAVADGLGKGEQHAHACDHEQAVTAALRKVSWVVLPQLFLMAAVNYLDRTSLSFASLQMNADLSLSTQQYGLAAAMFALGYGVGHIPSAYMGMKFGMRGWLAFITTAWGVVSICGALVHNSLGLYLQRVALGLTEAGAVPCAMHLLAQFYPRSRLTKPITVVTLGMTLSTIAAPPLAAGLMSIDTGGLRGWHWLFLVYGAATMLLGVCMWFGLPSRPLNGNDWMLTREQQQLLESEVHGALAMQHGSPRKVPSIREMLQLMWEAAKIKTLWFFTFCGFLWVLCVHSLNAFTPLIIANMLAGTAAAGSTSTGGSSAINKRNAMLLSALPYALAAIGMTLTSWHSDCVRERTLHIGLTAMAGSIFWLCFGPMYQLSFVAGFVSLSLTLCLAYSQMGVMYSRVAEPIQPQHMSIAIAMFNAIGAAVGGFLGPYVTGAVVQRMGSFVSATLIQGSFLLISGSLVTALGLWEQVQKRKARKLLGSSRHGGGGGGGGGSAGGGEAPSKVCSN